jgi:hypothetical protein
MNADMPETVGRHGKCQQSLSGNFKEALYQQRLEVNTVFKLSDLLILLAVTVSFFLSAYLWFQGSLQHLQPGGKCHERTRYSVSGNLRIQHAADWITTDDVGVFASKKASAAKVRQG